MMRDGNLHVNDADGIAIEALLPESTDQPAKGLSRCLSSGKYTRRRALQWCYGCHQPADGSGAAGLGAISDTEVPKVLPKSVWWSSTTYKHGQTTTNWACSLPPPVRFQDTMIQVYCRVENWRYSILKEVPSALLTTTRPVYADKTNDSLPMFLKKSLCKGKWKSLVFWRNYFMSQKCLFSGYNRRQCQKIYSCWGSLTSCWPCLKTTL